MKLFLLFDIVFNHNMFTYIFFKIKRTLNYLFNKYQTFYMVAASQVYKSQ